MSLLRFLLSCSVSLSIAGQGFVHAQSVVADPVDATEPPIAEEVEEDVVQTVKMAGDRTDTVSGTGEREGVDEAPEFEAVPDTPTPGNVGTLPTYKPLPTKPAIGTDPFDPSRVTYASTRKDARTISLLIPAPRGQITDRFGNPLAQSEVAYRASIVFGQLKDESDAHILSVARNCLAEVARLGIEVGEFKDEDLIAHYRDRRWLPLPISDVLRAKDADKYRKRIQKIEAAELSPQYIRTYPGKNSACHLLGHPGVKSKLAKGPINYNDPVFEFSEGRSGLEQKYDAQLTGRPGVRRLMFDENGKELINNIQSPPKPGGTVVTTLNAKWQKLAEKALQGTAKRGALVILDCRTGEVLAMASNPTFDPNSFVPGISQKEYDKLRNDPSSPLVSRAFAGVYPPASTFKAITVASALYNGAITEDTLIDCPASITIGNHIFRNHSKNPAGSINCVQALASSNNVFMYKAAVYRMKNETRLLMDTARRFGYGSTTGIPLPDKAGCVPDELFMSRRMNRTKDKPYLEGDSANMSIGQGVLLATPLQVAHAMCGIANGTYLPKLHLVKQILDINGNVVYNANMPEIQNNLTDYKDACAVVRKGMRAVVDGGTGSRAALSYTSNSGKTGTAQWGKESDECLLAWFAGFLPSDNPRYAYAALYEGSPHEVIAGGRVAASIVKKFFESVKDDVKATLVEDANAQKINVPELPAADRPAIAPSAGDDAAAPSGGGQAPSGWDDGRNNRTTVGEIPR
ncbi:beta-lactamase/transpeptidase-like [Akkermansia glycaniphila]|uniref:Beta-lactamase/transpeptidase-like n=1 Tax=Akkermansia glycaniphila TaxID=1679444 RepID=A0A1C7P9J3_9BACT|nr:hypothetical protein AC781_11825 [Akkermansia glycaniphila]SEH98794.1 beta-lactamase/transpeptidase-like [Akkermansia glycaniphila]